MKELGATDVRQLEAALFRKYGDLKWWPAESADEVLIGAILTQNTSWRNVETCIASLRINGMLSCCSISESGREKLAVLIRSSGFYNQKAERLTTVCGKVCEDYGTLELMARRITMEKAREFFSGIKGIGRETLSSILLYALHLPVFVMDKYTWRMLGRLGFETGEKRPDHVESVFVSALGGDVNRLRNLHAMIVNLAKDNCKSKPICETCLLRDNCDYAGREIIVP